MKYFIGAVLLGSLMFGHKDGMNLSNTPGCSVSSNIGGYSVAVDSKYRVHTLWQEIGSSNIPSLYYKRSVNNGATFEDTVKIGDSLSTSGKGFTMVTNNVDAIHTFWIDYNNNPVYRRSLNGGNFWMSTDTIDFGDNSEGITAAASGSNKVNVMWLYSDSIFKYKRSNDTGSTWFSTDTIGIAQTVTCGGTGFAPWPSIAASGNYVHAVWHSVAIGDTLGEIFYRRSSNNGTSWGTKRRITDDTLISLFPSITATGNYVYIGWFQDSCYYFSRSTDNGTNWFVPVCLLPKGSVDAGNNPQINAKDNFVAVAASGIAEGLQLIFSTDYGVNWDSVMIASENDTCVLITSAIDDSGFVHMVWTNINNDSFEVYYSRYSMGVGTEENSGFENSNYKLEISQNPFRYSTNIKFNIAGKSQSRYVSLTIHDISGRCVKTLVEGEKKAGSYNVNLDAKGLTSGIYFLTLKSGNYQKTNKLVLMK